MELKQNGYNLSTVFNLPIFSNISVRLVCLHAGRSLHGCSKDELFILGPRQINVQLQFCLCWLVALTQNSMFVESTDSLDNVW